MPEPNFNCDYCGNAGYNSPSRMKRNKHNFCSRECSSDFKNKQTEVYCSQCESVFIKAQWEILRSVNSFCSKACEGLYRSRKKEVYCRVCHKTFLKHPYDIKRNARHCCSKECAYILSRELKDWGSSRSKLEVALEKHLSETFLFHIDYNKTKIGYELDIYIPHLNQAIELNGIFHYKAIFGEDELLRRQKVDLKKIEECKKRNINLIVINVSEDGKSKKIQAQRIEEVVKIIEDRIEEMTFKPEIMQLVMNF